MATSVFLNIAGSNSLVPQDSQSWLLQRQMSSDWPQESQGIDCVSGYN